MLRTKQILEGFVWALFRSSEHKGAYISPPICTNKLIFGKGA